MAWALGLAATQPVGLREMFGSMTKSFHPGRAAQNGMTAALLAERGYTSSTEAIEAKRGWGNVLGTNPHYGAVIEGLGERWEILGNTYKPFACGLVVHPTIDGCLQLRHEGLDPAQIERVALAVHPWVIELTSKRTPQTGLEGKFSVYHAAAVALIEGDGGERQFSDRAVRDPAIVALRERVDATIAPGMALDAARVEVSLRDGTTLVRDVPHSIGSLARPMTDAALEAKFHGLADDVIGAGRSDALIRLCWSLADLADAAEIARAARPA
jgi:2-methylcitrate dehydratase PrpD